MIQKQTLFTNPTPANIKQGNIDTNSIPPSHNINDKKHWLNSTQQMTHTCMMQKQTPVTNVTPANMKQKILRQESTTQYHHCTIRTTKVTDFTKQSIHTAQTNTVHRCKLLPKSHKWSNRQHTQRDFNHNQQTQTCVKKSNKQNKITQPTAKSDFTK